MYISAKLKKKTKLQATQQLSMNMDLLLGINLLNLFLTLIIFSKTCL